MNKFWKVFTHEYTRHVLRRRFLLALLSVPLWIIVSVGLAVLSVFLQSDRTPVGFVDPGSVVLNTEQPETSRSFRTVQFLRYADEEEARAALEAKQIQAYFVLPEDYLHTLSAKLVYLESPDATITYQFENILRVNLLAGRDPQLTHRLIEGPDLEIRATEESAETARGDWLRVAAPIIAGIFLTASIFTSSGYLMQAVVEEKENRTIEILATSLSPGQIMAGKTTALILVGLTQVLVWSLFPLLAVPLVSAYFPMLQNFAIDWRMLGLIALTVLPTFVLIGSLMASAGATVTEAREGQQISGLISLPIMAPFMLVSAIAFNPNGPLALFLSFFPLTAALTLLMRLGFASVPTWQIIASAGILLLSAAGSLWLSGRIFRAGMLRYGKRMGWKDVLAAIRPGRSANNLRQVDKDPA